MPATAKPKTIAQYINAAPRETREKLQVMLKCLRKAAPKAEEGLKWGMPALSYDRILFMFAAFRQHVSLYPTPGVIKAFAKELAGLKTSEGTIQFPLDKPMPLLLIRRIAVYRVKQVKEKDAKWM
jgi:uncharacterized protein YdhG (YjbR/CyaY superfamily)